MGALFDAHLIGISWFFRHPLVPRIKAFQPVHALSQVASLPLVLALLRLPDEFIRADNGLVMAMEDIITVGSMDLSSPLIVFRARLSISFVTRAIIF
jgi:hypothetical protein